MAIIVLIGIVTPHVFAANESYVEVLYPPTPGVTPIPMVEQGATVYVGDYIDVSGVVPPYPQLAYWDGHDMYDALPSYNITMPDRKIGYYQFYLDPEVFGSRLGKWYKYDNKFERSGYNVAFIVQKRNFNGTMTFPNGTIRTTTESINATYYPVVTPTPQIVPEQYVSDYVVARGDPLIINTLGESKVWVFGNKVGIFDRISSSNTTILGIGEVWGLEIGRYELVIQYPGRNGIFEASYNNKTDRLVSPWKNVNDIPLTGLTPTLVSQRLKSMVAGTDDKYETYKIEVQEPSIRISDMVQRPLANRPDFHITPDDGEVSMWDVRGYTNVMEGSTLTFYMDKDLQNARTINQSTYTTVAKGSNPGNLRYFQVYIPIFWNRLTDGIHTVSGTTPIGGNVVSNFPVSTMPADSFRPNATLKYINDENPWKPNLTTPTPVIVQVPGPTQIVTVVVTPSEEQVVEAQRKVSEENWNKMAEQIVTIAIVGTTLLILICAGLYIRSVYIRGKKK